MVRSAPSGYSRDAQKRNGNEFIDRDVSRFGPWASSRISESNVVTAEIRFRYLFWETGVISANFIVPLNDQGLRTDFIPTVEVEYAFSAPW